VAQQWGGPGDVIWWPLNRHTILRQDAHGIDQPSAPACAADPTMTKVPLSSAAVAQRHHIFGALMQCLGMLVLWTLGQP
jgi:hypothetical protein